MINLAADKKLYKQEGRTGLFQSMLWAISVARSRAYIPVSWGEFYVFLKKEYVGVCWDADGFERVAGEVLRAHPRGLPQDWQKEWRMVDDSLTEAARALVGQDMASLSLEVLRGAYERLFELDQKMWSLSIFIDAFDPGFDQAHIAKIAAQYGFAEEEAQLLVSPVTPAFVTEWNEALQALQNGTCTKEVLKEKFFWYATNYTQFGECTDEFIESELQRTHKDEFVSPQEAQEKVLAKYALVENPLLLFQTLTAWRDARKRLNYTGLYGLLKVLREVLRRQGIDQALAGSVLLQQVPLLFAGSLDAGVLKKQLEDGVFVVFAEDGSPTVFIGFEAERAWQGVESHTKASHQEDLRGSIASRGKAVGRVRLVPHITNQNAANMQAGDILVSSMTRPEFVPLMRLAGAIVTNEGGITSHAAIVSRELGKPCIIGTKVATHVLRDGDLVEVDANEGVVRIIERV